VITITLNRVAHLNDENIWWKSSVFYQVYPRSFKDSNGDGIGDLPGIISKLDYLNDGTRDSLGIDAIWFSPFFKSPDYDYGYDVSDYYNIDPRYGTMKDFEQILNQAHSRNIKIVIDLVVNHTSSLHPWFLESRSSRNNPRRNWYIWADGREGNRKPPNNWRNNFFGSAWSWDQKTEQYYLHSFLKEQPDLNWSNPEVRQAIADVIRFWLERGVDGFRLDVAHLYCKDPRLRDNPGFLQRCSCKRSNQVRLLDRQLIPNIMRLLSLPELQVKKYNQHQPETHQVLKDFRKIIDSYPVKTSIGEIMADNPARAASYYGDNCDELHMNFYFELLHCRWKASSFRRCIELWEQALPDGAWPAYTFSNHDVKRAISRYGNDGKEDLRARLLMMLLLTLRGTPFIYYGEEIGMKEAKLKRNQLKDPVGIKWFPFHPGRDGCRTPMQWDQDENAGFSSNEPWLPLGPEIFERNVTGQNKEPHSMLNYTRELIWLRKELPALLNGSYYSLTEHIPAECYCFMRKSEEQSLIVCLNFSSRRQEISLEWLNEECRIMASTNPNNNKGFIKTSLKLEGLEGLIIMVA